MIDPKLVQAAKRLSAGGDLLKLVDFYKSEQIGLVISGQSKKEVHRALSKFHAIDEFNDFVEQIKLEADNGR